MTDPRIERIARRCRATERVAQLVVPLDDPELDLDTIADVFPSWTAGVTVAAGDVVRHDGALWRVVQGHTTQADWPPPAVPALFTRVRDTTPAQPSPWVQPTGAHDAYQQGDRVTHNGQVWESTVNANVWAPPTFWTVV